MTIRRLILFASTGALLGLLIGSTSLEAQSVTLHDSTGNGFDTNWLVGLSTQGGTNINQPAEAIVVSGGDYLLEAITVLFSASSIESGGTPDDYEIRFWDNDVDKPGTLLESFTVPDSVALSGPVTVTSATQPTLSNGGTYWVSASLPDDLSNGTWDGVLGEAAAGRAIAFSGSASASWSASTNNNRQFYLKVTGTAVPEPGALLLVCGGVGLVALRRCRCAG